MAFSGLPNEMIIEIAGNLDKERDINSLTRVSRRFYDLFDDYLHCHNIRYRKCRALFWAAKHGRESTARKLLHLGADVNVQIDQAGFNAGGSRAGLTPLHFAAAKGHLAMVKLLLEVGADPEARVQDSSTPLYFALVARHGKIARIIFRRIENPQSCLVDTKRKLTALHVSCRLGLWNCAQYFLNEGANVNATDARAMTPLHHALSDFGGGEYHPGPGEIFETVKVLMKFGANQKAESTPRYIWERPITAFERGINHPYDRVRALFSNVTGDSLHNTSKSRPHSRHIGRTWMLPTLSPMCARDHNGPNLIEHIDTKRSFNSYRGARTSDGDQRQPDSLDLSSFPALDSASQPHIPSLKTHTSDGLWSPANVDSLIAGFSVCERGPAPITEQSSRVFHFPELNSRISGTSQKIEPGRLWAHFGRPKGQPVAEKELSNPASSEKNSVQEESRTTERGKNRWQPLKF